MKPKSLKKPIPRSLKTKHPRNPIPVSKFHQVHHSPMETFAFALFANEFKDGKQAPVTCIPLSSSPWYTIPMSRLASTNAFSSGEEACLTKQKEKNTSVKRKRHFKTEWFSQHWPKTSVYILLWTCWMHLDSYTFCFPLWMMKITGVGKHSPLSVGSFSVGRNLNNTYWNTQLSKQ